MRGLYITSWNLNDSSSGVAKKIKGQVNILQKELGQVEIYDRSNFSFSKMQQLLYSILSIFRLSGILETRIMYENLFKKKQLSGYNFIYVRKSYFTLSMIKALKRIKQENPPIKILVEIPTYPYDKEIKWYDFISLFVDRIARKNLNYCIDRIVTFSDDQQIFGIDTIRISNGVDYDKNQLRNPISHDGINLIAVALFASWHGYDRVIEGMYKDIDVVKKEKIRLHLIGQGRILIKYKKLVQKYGLDDYVIFHGSEFGEQLNNSFDIADIGLDAMGRHRCGVYYNSTLKGKEYCARGLPIISGVKTELDFINDAYYYHRVTADDSPISMQQVVYFYQKVNNSLSLIKMSLNIREQTKNIFSLQNSLKPIVDYLK